MVRKQVYLTAEQDCKVKRLAAKSGRTESDVIRSALNQAAEAADDDPVIAKLRAAGVLAPKPSLPPELVGVDREELERKWAKLMAKRKEPLRLGEAVIEDREDRMRRISGI
jgi:antitoxin ParD1/3/4